MKKILATLMLIGTSLAFTAQAQVAQPGRAGWQTDTYSNCKIWNPIPQAGETVEWLGECKNGYAEGSGQLTWKFSTGNEVWNINMAAGKSGTGPYKIVTTHNGTTSTWTGTFTNGIKTGVNVRTFADGNQFEGSWTNGQANGPSVYTTKDGERQSVFAANGCIWSAETGGTFINSVDKNKNQCLSERSTSSVATNTSSVITECHALASSPADPQRKVQGVPFEKINPKKAIAACRLATQQSADDGQLWFEYGRALERGNMLPDAITAYQTGINLNNAGAMNNLGELYLDGKGVQKNLATAESLFKRAAAMGFPEARENLARLNPAGTINPYSTIGQNNEIGVAPIPLSSSHKNSTTTVAYPQDRSLEPALRKQSRLLPCPEGVFPNTCFGTYSDGGYTYTGEWERGQRNGLGAFTLRNKGKFVGTWKNGDGINGVMTYPDGRVAIGIIKNETFYPSTEKPPSESSTSSVRTEIAIRPPNALNQNELENEWWAIKKQELAASANGNGLVSERFRKEMDSFKTKLSLITHVENWKCDVKRVSVPYGLICPSGEGPQLAAIECVSQIKPDIGYYKPMIYSEFKLCITQTKVNLDSIVRGQKIEFSGSFKNSEPNCIVNCSGLFIEHNGVRLNIKNAKLIDVN